MYFIPKALLLEIYLLLFTTYNDFKQLVSYFVYKDLWNFSKNQMHGLLTRQLLLISFILVLDI